jgi:hypothetical protein
LRLCSEPIIELKCRVADVPGVTKIEAIAYGIAVAVGIIMIGSGTAVAVSVTI